MQTISAEEAATRLDAGNGVVIDIRSANEFALGHIPGALHLEAERIDADAARRLAAMKPIFCCATGRRTAMLMDRLAGSGGADTVCIQGGLDAWMNAGFDINRVSDAPSVPSIQRQVMITVGFLLLVIAALSYTLWPSLIVAAGVIGLGLFMAGITGTCMLAQALMLMPWNRPRRPTSGAHAQA